MAAVDPRSVDLAYRDQSVKIAQIYFPGKVGTGYDGFARASSHNFCKQMNLC